MTQRSVQIINSLKGLRYLLKQLKSVFLKDGPGGVVQIPFPSPNKPTVSTLKFTSTCIGLLNALEGASSLVLRLKKIILTSP